MYGFVTVPEFSVLMGISTDTVYRLVKKDAIPYYKVGKNIRLNIKFAVEMYMRANRDEIGTIE